MNSSVKRSVIFNRLALIGIPLALLASSVNATADTWTGSAGDGIWSNANNWSPVAAPAVGDSLIFTSAAGATTNLTDDDNVSLAAVTFNTSAAAYSIGVGGSVTALALTGALTDNSAGSIVETINLAINGTSASSLAFGSDNSGGNSLTLGATDTFGSLKVSSNSTTANTLAIGSNTLNLTGTFGIGTAPPNPGSTSTNAILNITGTGTFNITSATNSSFNIGVGAGSNTPTGQPLATVDMTGLSNFIFSTGTGSFGVGNLVTRSSSTLRLANTSNSITAATIGIGDTNQSGGNNSGAGSNLFLGAGANVLNANSINVGFTKGAGSIQFQTGTGSVTIDGETGGASTANITVGRGSSATDTNTASQFLLAGHTANIQAGTVQVGVLAGSTGGTPAGILTFDTGTFTVNSLQIGVDSSGSAPNGASGTFTLGGATPNATATGVLNVSGATPAFFLVNGTNTNTGARTDKGTFTINGGTANINADIQSVKAAATGTTINSTLTLAAGTLNMNGHQIGNATTPITTVNFPAASQTATLSNLGGTGVTTSVNTSGGLLMNGAGTLILAGSNTYTGNTTVQSGVINVTGSLANNSSANVFVSAGNDFTTAAIIRQVNSGSSYAGMGSTATGTAPRLLGSAADILAGTNSGSFTGSAANMSMAWRVRATNETTTGEGGTPTSPPLPQVSGPLISDVIQLSGMTSRTVDPSLTDPFALQMTYSPSLLGNEAVESADGSIYLGWLNPSGGGAGVPLWQNAVAGNTGNNATPAEQNFQGSFAAFQTAVGDTNIADYIGAWGVDSTNHDAWAVVDHNSQFAVVPEPGTIVLAVFGAAGFLVVGLRRTSIATNRRRASRD